MHEIFDHVNLGGVRAKVTTCPCMQKMSDWKVMLLKFQFTKIQPLATQFGNIPLTLAHSLFNPISPFNIPHHPITHIIN